jgi:NAD-dependent protein deacetylase/lipoamidase
VQPAASFVDWARGSGRAGVRAYYIGPEHPANADSFDEVFQGRAGEVLPRLFAI